MPKDKKDKKGAAVSTLDKDKEKKKRRVAQPRQKGRMKEYFKGVKVETKKVVWPTRRELVSYTIVVLIACIFFGLLIWGVDSAFLAGLSKLVGIEIGS
jgi:preprotein translocase subunit SecE